MTKYKLISGTRHSFLENRKTANKRLQLHHKFFKAQVFCRFSSVERLSQDNCKFVCFCSHRKNQFCYRLVPSAVA